MSDALRRELDRWGFSDAEIDVYLAVLRLGEGSASEIGDLADVSARHVYRVCERLEERGLVDLDEHVQPTRIRARPPTAVEGVVQDSATTIAQEIDSLYSSPPEAPSDIEVLKRQTTIFDRLRSIVEDAEEWLLLVAPADVVTEVTDALADAIDRDVLVFLLTTVPELPDDLDLAEIATVVRTRPDAMGFQEIGVGADKHRSMMLSPSSQLGDEHRYSPALYMNDDVMGPRSVLTLFGIEWRLGEEYCAPEPVALPHTTDVHRTTLFHAASHRRAGTDLRARVEARSTDDDRSTTIDGAVTEVRQEFFEPYGQNFLSERVLVLETDDGEVTFGGPLASIEDYRADRVTLYEAGNPPAE